MEVMNPIYIAPHMTTLTKMTILYIHFTLFYPMKGDVVIECLRLEEDPLVNGMSKKIINQAILIRSVGNLHVYETPENSFFIAAHAIWAREAVFNLF